MARERVGAKDKREALHKRMADDRGGIMNILMDEDMVTKWMRYGS
jgi:hypothetical protein